MTAPFRSLDGRDILALQPPFTLTPAELVEVSTIDPSNAVDSARLRGLRHRVARRSRSGHATDDSRLIDWLLESFPTTAPKPKPALYDNPARLDGPRQQRSLAPGDFEFVRTLATERPERAAPEDVRHLAELEAAASSESERRVVGRVLAPIRRHHDRLEEESTLRHELASVPTPVRRPAVTAEVTKLLRLRLAEERRAELEPAIASAPAHLREQLVRDLVTEVSSAERAATPMLQARWAEADAQVAQRTTEGQRRLTALVLGADPVSSSNLPPFPDPALQAARERGRAHAEQRSIDRDGHPNAFAGFRSLTAPTSVKEAS